MWRRREGVIIFTSASASHASDSFVTGAIPGAGTFFCIDCGSQLSLRERDRIPDCPRCGFSLFRRDSIFEPMQDHSESTAELAIPVGLTTPSWLDEARSQLQSNSRCIVYRDDGKIQTFPIRRGWMRIGRSVAADVRLDDPSVSRRHALIVSEAHRSLRVLDDRSLNGVFVNGTLVEWERLKDGDELTVGRYHLFAIEA
jgi:hypothetical protein